MAAYNSKYNTPKRRKQYARFRVKGSYHANKNTEASILFYTHFTLEERKYLQKLLSDGLSFHIIAAILERSPSNVSREVRRNCSKFSKCRKLYNKYEKLLDDLPIESISLDNGSEFSEFRKLKQSLNTIVYFAEPHKSWQRGTNENANDIIRFFFSKGFDFRTITDEDVQFVEGLINNRPRKCFGWKTSNEIFAESVALA